MVWLVHAGAVFWPDYWGEGCRELAGREREVFTAATPRNKLFQHAIADIHFRVRTRAGLPALPQGPGPD